MCISNDAYRQVRGKVEIICADMGPQHLEEHRRTRCMRGGFDGGQSSSSSRSRSTLIEPQALPLPDKPSIAVLPFQNMSGDPEQEYFADGMVEEITTALSRSRWLFVIARNRPLPTKAKRSIYKQVGRELGVRYVLEGSVRRSADRVRMTGQLIEVSNQYAPLG